MNNFISVLAYWLFSLF